MDSSDGNSVIEGICSALVRMDDLYSAWAKKHGETYLSMWVLEELGEHPEGLTQKQLAQEMHTPKQTVNSIAVSLEKRGLICTKPSPVDKRSKIHTLAERGRARYANVRAEQIACENACINSIGQDRIERMIADVNETLDCLEQALFSLNTLEGTSRE